MKVALVHELLTMRGGAERVLRILADMFPDAPIYTLLYDEKKLGEWFPKERVRTSIIQNSLQFKLNSQFSILNSQLPFNHHLYLKKFPNAVETWDFSGFDLVISTSSAFVHGIITNSAPKHLSYIHSPARYLWDRTHDVTQQASKSPLGFFKKIYLERIFHKLRIWDGEAADRPDTLLAVSKNIQRRIELYWRKESEIIYPPIDDSWFEPRPKKTVSMEHPNYFLIISSLVKYKRIDLAIEACNNLGVHLKIIGEGPDKARLEKRAGPTVEFYGWREGDEVKDLLTQARATIFPGDEDLGLVPVESMASGTPVIAYRGGGALETIIEGVTGEFFDEPNADSLQKVIENFVPTSPDGLRGGTQKKYSKDALLAQAKKFSRAEFERKMREKVAQL